MKVDNVKVLALKDRFYSRGQPRGNSNPGNGTAAGDGAGATYRYEPIAKAGNSLRGGGNNLNLMPHPGKVVRQIGNVNVDTARIGEIVRGDQCYFHRWMLKTSVATLVKGACSPLA